MKNQLVESFFEDGIKNPKNKSYYNNFYNKKNNENWNKEIEYYENKIKEIRKKEELKKNEENENELKYNKDNNYLNPDKNVDALDNFVTENQNINKINKDFEENKSINRENNNENNDVFRVENDNNNKSFNKKYEEKNMYKTNYFNESYVNDGIINDDQDFYDNNRILNQKLNNLDHIDGFVHDERIKLLKIDQAKSFQIALENQIREKRRRKELELKLKKKEEEKNRLKLENELVELYNLKNKEKLEKKNENNINNWRDFNNQTENTNKKTDVNVLDTKKFELELQREKEMMKELPNVIEKKIKTKLDDELEKLRNELNQNTHKLKEELINIKNYSFSWENEKRKNLNDIYKLRNRWAKMQYRDEIRTNELLNSLSQNNHYRILPQSNYYSNPTYLKEDHELEDDLYNKKYEEINKIDYPKNMYSYNHFIPLDYEYDTVKYNKNINKSNIEIDNFSLNLSYESNYIN